MLILKTNQETAKKRAQLLSVQRATLKHDEENEDGVFFDFSLTVKAAPHECVIRTGQP